MKGAGAPADHFLKAPDGMKMTGKQAQRRLRKALRQLHSEVERRRRSIEHR